MGLGEGVPCSPSSLMGIGTLVSFGTSVWGDVWVSFSGFIKMWLNSWLCSSVHPGDDIPPSVKYLTALVVIHTGNKLFSFLQVDLITRLESHG